MRVAVVTGVLDQPTRGNHTTVQRWMRHVAGVQLVAVPADAEQTLAPVPDVIHGYHARNGGVAALALARRYARPLVLSLGGTDFFAFLDGDAEMRAVLGAADCVVGAFDSFGEALDRAVRRYVTVPRGVELPAAPPVPRPADGTLRVLLPAGLRDVKDPLLALDLAEDLRARGLPAQLEILGPALDEAYARRVHARAEALAFVTVGEVEPGAMADAYGRSDVVWNTSRHEGGANALLEGLAHGCAVLARDVAGNREYFAGADAPGALFDPADRDAFAAWHRARLEETDAERRARTARSRAWLAARHDPAREAAALVEIWRSTQANAP